MRLACLSDLHLGFRSFDRVTPSGVNQREADVAETFRRAIDRLIALAPDVITIAGDVFHSSKPSNLAILTALDEFGRLTQALPYTIVIAISGNHDEPKAHDAECILPVLRRVGVTVVHGGAMRLTYADRELSVLCVPDVHGINRPAIAPDPAARFNVLVMHGEVMGVTQGGADRRSSLRDVSPDELRAEDWSFVALGHYHQREALAPNVVYSGSLDYVSSNVWAEIETPKGITVVNLATGERSFEAVEPARAFFDLARIDAHGMTPADLDARIAERMASVPIDGACVRLIVDGVSRETERGLDRRRIKDYERRAMAFRFDPRRPDPMVRIRSVTAERKQQLESLVTRLERTLTTVELPEDLDRGEFVALGLRYFTDASDKHGETSAEESPVLVHQLQTSLDQTLLKRTA